MELILMYVSRFSVVIPLFLLITGENRFKDKTINILGLLLLVSGLTDMITYIMGAKELDTAFVSNFYTLTEFILLCLLFIELLSEHKKMIYLSMGIFILFFLMDSVMIENLSDFQSYTIALEGIFLLSFSTVYYIKHMKLVNTPIPISKEISEKNLLESKKLYKSIFNSKNESNFWFNSAIFFYFMMDIYLFTISRYVFENEPEDIAMTFWSFHNICNIIKNAMFAGGIYYAGIKRIQLNI